MPLVLSAVGLERRPWPTDTPGASWVGLCPDNRMRGGTGLATGRRPVHNRASRALRRAAHSLRTSPRALGACVRRMRRTLGPAPATTAPAHPLATMLSPMLQETPPIGHAVPRRIGPQSRSVSSAHDASKPSTSAVLWCLKHAMNPQAERRDDAAACKNLPDEARRDRALRAPESREAALSLHSPGRETDVPLVALSPCVSVGPRAHDGVTGEACGLCRTALPSRR